MYKYVYVLLDRSQSPLFNIKTIMYEGKICANNGQICIYAPYNELHLSYRSKFSGAGMWGIGFSMSALKKKALWDNCQSPVILEQLEYKGLQCCKIKVEELNFTKLEFSKDDVFVVVPSSGDMEGLCFHGCAPGTEYKLWWCKGIWANSSGNRQDKDINNYLNDNRFYKDKYIPQIDKKKLFPEYNLVDGDVLVHDYNLLKLTPEEMNEGSCRSEEAKSTELF